MIRFARGYEIVRKGWGKTPNKGDKVTVHYVGWLEDDTCLDNSFVSAEPSKFTVGRKLIQGWNEGFLFMNEGAIFMFTIPSRLGYGTLGSPPVIPPGASLIFQLEMIKVGDE